jgi:sodium pump decarboxylase gamma subunit
MHNKWMILVAGVATVFAALMGLILIVFILKQLFGKKAEKKRKDPKPSLEPAHIAMAAKAVASPAAAASAGTELIAVITAAIAATTGSSPSSFRIASVNASSDTESGFNTPVWGRIERFTRKDR